MSDRGGRLLVPRTRIIAYGAAQSVEVRVEFPNHTMESDEEFREALSRSLVSLQGAFRQARYLHKKALDENAQGKTRGPNVEHEASRAG